LLGARVFTVFFRLCGEIYGFAVFYYNKHFPVMTTTTPPPRPPGNIMITYMTLRKVIGWLGISLSPVMVLGNFILDHTHVPQVSLSAYYYTSMRNQFEGIICGIAMFLVSYHGYTKQDSVFSKIAGFSALGIAFFATSDTGNKSDPVSILHYVTAGIFFAALSYMSVFLFTKSTAPVMTPQKIKRNRVYRVCGIIMAVCIAFIPVDGITAIHDAIGFLKPTLIVETIALVAFGISWLTKGEFWLKDGPPPHSPLVHG
jgi:hypothetical protein